MNSEVILSPTPALPPAPLFTPTPKAAKRVLEFFTAQINNDYTRKAPRAASRNGATAAASAIASLSLPAWGSSKGTSGGVC